MDIRITPHKSWNSEWWWYSFSSKDLSGLTPVFKIAKADLFQTGSVAHRFGCYGSSVDSDVWTDFDTPVIGAADIELTPTSSLSGGNLYFSFYPMYPYLRTSRKVSEWMENDLVSDTTSGTGGVVGVATERANGLEDKTAPALNFYGIKITKTSGNTKNKAILVSGNHAGETTGRFTLEGAVDWLIGGSAEANTLLEWFEFYIYPCVCPQGVWGGYFRSCPENPALNHNREWDDTGVLESVDITKTAMAADTGGTIEVGIDYHGFGTEENSGINMAYVVDKSGALFVSFETKIKALEGIGFNLIDAAFAGTTLWEFFNDSYSARLGMTIETSGLLAYSVSDYKSYGENSMMTLYEMLNDGDFTNGP